MNEVAERERRALDGVAPKLAHIGHHRHDVVHDAVVGADGVLKRREGDRAAVEGQARKGRAALVGVWCVGGKGGGVSCERAGALAAARLRAASFSD